MWSTAFWKAAAERAAKSAAQAVLGLWVMERFNILEVDWALAGGVAAGAAALSLLTSVVSAPFGPTGTPSLVGEPTAASATAARRD